MAKLVVEMGYRSLVVDAEQGIALCNLLSKAEVYESKYHSSQGNTPSHNTQHIYPLDPASGGVVLKLLSDEAYQMYKLAGKPEQ